MHNHIFWICSTVFEWYKSVAWKLIEILLISESNMKIRLIKNADHCYWNSEYYNGRNWQEQVAWQTRLDLRTQIHSCLTACFFSSRSLSTFRKDRHQPLWFLVDVCAYADFSPCPTRVPMTVDTLFRVLRF